MALLQGVLYSWIMCHRNRELGGWIVYSMIASEVWLNSSLDNNRVFRGVENIDIWIRLMV